MLNFNSLKLIDWTLFAIVIILLGLGLSAIYSVSYSGSENLPELFLRQAVFAVLGLVIMILIVVYDYRIIKKYTAVFFLVGIVLLLILLIWKNPIKGASSWIKFGSIGFEVAELVKLFLIIILAKFFSKNIKELHKWRYILISGFYAAIFILLIIMQPDLGSAIIVGSIWLGMVIVAGIRYRYLASLSVVMVLILAFGWLFVLAPYQKERILSFANPSKDPKGSSYNVNQSIVAIGSGGLFGKGLGAGSQSQLKFIPEAHTDFIFAVFAEEWGLLGVSFLLLLFGLFFWRLLKIAAKARDNFGRMIVLGTIIMVLTQVVINVGMNMGLLPVTGIPLPLISYGGTSLVSNLIILGVIQSINIRSYEYLDREKNWLLEV